MKKLKTKLILSIGILLVSTSSLLCMEKEEEPIEEEITIESPVIHRAKEYNKILNIQEKGKEPFEKEEITVESPEEIRISTRAKENIRKAMAGEFYTPSEETRATTVVELIHPLVDKENLIIELSEIAIETKKPVGFSIDGKNIATFYAPDIVLMGTGANIQQFKMPALLNLIDLIKEEKEKKLKEQKKKKSWYNFF